MKIGVNDDIYEYVKDISKMLSAITFFIFGRNLTCDRSNFSSQGDE